MAVKFKTGNLVKFSTPKVEKASKVKLPTKLATKVKNISAKAPKGLKMAKIAIIKNAVKKAV